MNKNGCSSHAAVFIASNKSKAGNSTKCDLSCDLIDGMHNPTGIASAEKNLFAYRGCFGPVTKFE